MRNLSTGLIYTYKCNCECEMCGLNCSPSRTEKMTLQEAKSYVDASFDNDIYSFGITGGEPLLYKDEVFEILRYASNKGARRMTLTTNCFWAESMESAYAVMKKLKQSGLSHMTISYDEFHNQYIPIQRIKNVLKVSQEINLRVTIGSVVVKNDSLFFDLLREIQEEVLEHSITLYNLQLTGRAEKKYNREVAYRKINMNSCPTGKTLTITPDGYVFPCCSLFAINSCMKYGNIKHEDLKDIIDRIMQDKHLQYIFDMGIATYYPAIVEKFSDKIFHDECEVCMSVFNGLTSEERESCLMNSKEVK